MCCDKVFKITIFEDTRNISKCYCREEIIVSECVPAKAITRIINNISIRCPNSQNGCQWNCDSALDSVVRQNHVTDCRWGYDTWKFANSYKVVFGNYIKLLLISDSRNRLKWKKWNLKENSTSTKVGHYI